MVRWYGGTVVHCVVALVGRSGPRPRYRPRHCYRHRQRYFFFMEKNVECLVVTKKDVSLRSEIKHYN